MKSMNRQNHYKAALTEIVEILDDAATKLSAAMTRHEIADVANQCGDIARAALEDPPLGL